jgi:hypothetical protein
MTTEKQINYGNFIKMDFLNFQNKPIIDELKIELDDMLTKTDEYYTKPDANGNTPIEHNKIMIGVYEDIAKIDDPLFFIENQFTLQQIGKFKSFLVSDVRATNETILKILKKNNFKQYGKKI